MMMFLKKCWLRVFPKVVGVNLLSYEHCFGWEIILHRGFSVESWRGSNTVFYRYPDGKRAGTRLEYWFSSLVQAEKFKNE